MLEITEYHLSTLETFSILFRTTLGKKKTLQFPVLHYNHHVEHKMASYNLQQQKKIVVNLKKLIWPKNKKNKTIFDKAPIQKNKNEAHNFFVCEVFFFTLLRVKLYVLIKFQQHGVCTDDE